MRVVDLSGPIYTGMWQYAPVYPGAVITECDKPDFVPDDMECYCQKFEIGGQTGTYIETRAHIDHAAEPISDVPLEDLFFPLVVIRLPDLGVNERISLEALRAAAPDVRPGDAVLIRSGWDRKWRDPDFVDGSPFLSREAAEWLIERNIALLGSDFPRFDNIEKPEFPWQTFFDHVRFVLAPVVNLDAVSSNRATLAVFPLKIEHAVSLPCRAVAFEGSGAVEVQRIA